jgi:hypothetical protein
MRLKGFRASVLALGFSVAMSVSAVVPGFAASTTTVTVTPGNMQGWFFVQETPAPTPPLTPLTAAKGTLVVGPGTPPMGVGSARLPAPTSADGQALILNGYQGTKLADITQLGYSTFVATGGPPQAVSLQFTIDSDVTDANTSFQGRLVFEPYESNTVNANVWQTWDPTAGEWWATGGPATYATRPITAACPQSSPCLWSTIISNFQNAGIRVGDPAGVILKSGSNWTNFNGNVDKLVIGVGGNVTTFDFEPYDVATDKDECKGKGWQNVTRADGSSFKNQGDCVSYTNTGR